MDIIRRLMPRTWNDVLSLILVLLVFASWAILPSSGLPSEQLSLIIGAELAWVGMVVIYYYRKAAPPSAR